MVWASKKKQCNRCDISPGLTVKPSCRQQWQSRREVQCGFLGAQCPGERVKSKGYAACSAGRISVSSRWVFSPLSSVGSSSSPLCSCAVLLAIQELEKVRCHGAETAGQLGLQAWCCGSPGKIWFMGEGLNKSRLKWRAKSKGEIGHWLWVPRQGKHGQPQGKKLLCAGVTPSVSEGPGWSFTALGHLKAGQMDEQAEGGPF